MVIDAHAHPAFLAELDITEEELEYRKNMTGLYKSSRIPVERLFAQCDAAGIDKLFLLPLDLTTTTGGYVGTNEEVKRLVDQYPDRFIGFCSVDPNREDALEVLEHAFSELKLKGLKLHPSKQRFYPDDKKFWPLYELCLKYNKPIVFHAGMTAQPQALSKYSHPLNFEEIAYDFPKLRICLAHCAWPWVHELSMLLLKYPNIYTDTAALYFDNAPEFYHQIFRKDMGENWMERSFRHQIMFGSDDPRLEQIRMINALKKMISRESTLEMILGENALHFLGEV